MINPFWKTVIFLTFSLGWSWFLASVNAQTWEQNQPNEWGDYYQNETGQKGTIPSGSRLMAGGLWQVVTPVLNCREKPGISSPIIHQFYAEQILQAEVGRGGADEVLINALDQNRLPWMFVRGIGGENHLEKKCYVRANRRYIQPYFPSFK